MFQCYVQVWQLKINGELINASSKNLMDGKQGPLSRDWSALEKAGTLVIYTVESA